MKRVRTKFKEVQSVQITNCYRTDPQLKNMIPGSIHKVIEPPSYAITKKTWVQGTDFPVRLLKGEYEFIINQKIKTMLSDKLITIGQDSSKINNRSQALAADKMLDLLNSQKENYLQKTLMNITNHVIKILNKKGFNYYKFEIFFGQNN